MTLLEAIARLSQLNRRRELSLRIEAETTSSWLIKDGPQPVLRIRGRQADLLDRTRTLVLLDLMETLGLEVNDLSFARLALDVDPQTKFDPDGEVPDDHCHEDPSI